MEKVITATCVVVFPMLNPSTNLATNSICSMKLVSPTLLLSSRTNTRSVGLGVQSVIHPKYTYN